MKIEKIEKITKKVNFEELEVGDCYIDNDGSLCMKVDSFFSKTGEEYDCVYLETGGIGSYWGEVTLVKATIQYYIK